MAGLLKSDPLKLPGQNMLNASMGLGNVGAMAAYMSSTDPTLMMGMLGATTALSSTLGVTLTAAIGGEHRVLYAAVGEIYFFKFQCSLSG